MPKEYFPEIERVLAALTKALERKPESLTP
jgi:hypothetical protein